MIAKVQKFGNSKGIILPKQIMAMCSIGEQVSISVEDKHIIISSADRPRSDWEEQFKNAARDGALSEKALLEGLENEFDKNEWTW